MFKFKFLVKKRSKFFTLVILLFIGLAVFMFFSNYSIANFLQSNTALTLPGDLPQFGNELGITGEVTSKPKNLKKNLNSTLTAIDKREYVLEAYFATRNSPLMGHADAFVDACDKHGAPKDCITTAAIARHETDLCNYYVSAQEYNCMGWGGGPGHRVRFTSFEHHLDVATDVLVNQYGPKFMIDPSLMEKTFCGPQDECINWGNRVKRFMREIDDLGVALGVGRLTELRG